jgi:predicted peptidase
MIICLVLLAALMLFAASGTGALRQPPAAPQTGFLFHEVTAGGITMKYAVYVPRHYTPDKQWPAIVFLHGSGECGTDGQKMIIQGIGRNILWNADRWPCIVLFPQNPGAPRGSQGATREQSLAMRSWTRCDAAVMKMLEETRAAYSIDPDRIALTGLSLGGHGAWSIGAAHPEVWCAIAPICGFADAPRGAASPETIAAKLKDVPMWIFHGDADDVVSPDHSRNVAAAMKAAGAEAKLTLYPGVNHGSWDKAYEEAELPAFLMQTKKR